MWKPQRAERHLPHQVLKGPPSAPMKDGLDSAWQQMQSISGDPSYERIAAPMHRHWIHGPPTPRDDPPRATHPLLIPWESWPSQLNYRVSHRVRLLILIAYLSVWALLDYALLNPFSSGAKLNGEQLVSLSCTGEGHFWKGKNQMCGIGGEDCLPKHESAIVRCPALCDRGWTYSALPAGDEMIKYRQFAIGGGKLGPEGALRGQGPRSLTHPYRGDSSPCSSAVHGRALSPFFGGCVKLKFTGERFSFESKRGPYGTGWSVDFPAYFPSSFVFETLPIGLTGCHDPRFVVLLVNFILGAPVFYLCSGLVGYWVSCMAGFWTIVLALDPPMNVSDEETKAMLISNGFAKLLPLCFVLEVMWSCAVKHTISQGSPVCKTLIWYPLFWVGTANIITFDRLPVDRLTPHDIKEMPGSVFAVISILITVVICIMVQALQIWRAGQLVHYAKWYSVGLLGLVTLAQLPNLGLRIHHYILSIVSIPGTATRGMSAYILQGLLVGLMLSGIARWDFASIVETETSLLRGEAGAAMKPPTGLGFNGTHVVWNEPMIRSEELPGYSLVVNDVEWWVGEETGVDIREIIGFKSFFRLGLSELHGGDRGDYTRAGVLEDGVWTPPAAGVS